MYVLLADQNFRLPSFLSYCESLFWNPFNLPLCFSSLKYFSISIFPEVFAIVFLCIWFWVPFHLVSLLFWPSPSVTPRGAPNFGVVILQKGRKSHTTIFILSHGNGFITRSLKYYNQRQDNIFTRPTHKMYKIWTDVINMLSQYECWNVTMANLAVFIFYEAVYLFIGITHFSANKLIFMCLK